jgi:hypothetical protein
MSQLKLSFTIGKGVLACNRITLWERLLYSNVLVEYITGKVVGLRLGRPEIALRLVLADTTGR